MKSFNDRFLHNRFKSWSDDECCLKNHTCRMIRCNVHQVYVSLFLSERYFIPVACFLIFNVMDFVGRTVTLVSKWVSALLGD